ncbi:hypothetical protein DRO69_10700 [Candidatus Bathyarchaeota archaeon]|nr:MAG: hypothetical protein DRO69_10700 [Candidatus Bathyarchaeota archaeon]
MKRKYAFVSLLIYIFPAMADANSFNSIFYNYSSGMVGYVLFPLFLIQTLRNLRQTNYFSTDQHRTFIIGSMFLGGLILSYHILALTALGIVLVYLILTLTTKGKQKKILIMTLILGAIIGSPYVAHVARLGFPTSTGAFEAFSPLRLEDYVKQVGYFVPLAFVVGSSSIFTEFLREGRRPSDEYIFLASWLIFLFFMSQGNHFGIRLVNDRFAWYLAMPMSLTAILGFHSLLKNFKFSVSVDEKTKQRIEAFFFLAIVAMAALFSTGGSLTTVLDVTVKYKEELRSGGLFWLKENAGGTVVATSPVLGLILPAMSDVQVISVPVEMSDYYVRDLPQRIIDSNEIFSGTDLLAILNLLAKYNVQYLYIGKDVDADYTKNPYFLLGSKYAEPVFPLKRYVKETINWYDFDHDGVMETFRILQWRSQPRNYVVYPLLNDNNYTTLYVRSLFHPAGTEGPVNIFVNGIFVDSLTASESERGFWRVDKIEVNPWIIKKVNKIRIENMDPANNWYLDWMGFGPPPQNMKEFELGASIYKVNYATHLKLYSQLRYLNLATEPELFTTISPRLTEQYYLYWTPNPQQKLFIEEVLINSKVISGVSVFINGHKVGKIYYNHTTADPYRLSGNDLQMLSGLRHEFRINSTILQSGWNNITVVNEDALYEWHPSQIGFETETIEQSLITTPLYRSVAPTSFLTPSSYAADLDEDGVSESFDVLHWNGSSARYFIYASTGNETNIVLRDLFHKHGTVGPVIVSINDKRINYIAVNDTALRGKWLFHTIEIPSGTLTLGWNTIVFRNDDLENNWYVNYIALSSENAIPYQPPSISMVFPNSESFDFDADGVPEKFDVLPWKSSGLPTWERIYHVYSFWGNESMIVVNNLFHPAGTIGPIEIIINDQLVETLVCYEQENRGKWLESIIPISQGILKAGWNKIQFKNFDKQNNWYIRFIRIS